MRDRSDGATYRYVVVLKFEDSITSYCNMECAINVLYIYVKFYIQIKAFLFFHCIFVYLLLIIICTHCCFRVHLKFIWMYIYILQSITDYILMNP